MVWWLSPHGPSGGLSSHFFTTPGTYTLGRKGCSILIHEDMGISRVHAQISVEPVATQGIQKSVITNILLSKIWIKDLSKFGTFINKEPGSKPLISLPDATAELKEGDLITFGTKATFRLQHFPINLCVSSTSVQRKKEVLHNSAAAVGASISSVWTAACTHLLVEEGELVSDPVIQAAMHKKPVILSDWLQVLAAQKSPSHQLPELSSYAATLRLKKEELELSIMITQPEAREALLKEYTILVAPLQYYQHKERLILLVESSGGVLRQYSGELSKGTETGKTVLLIPNEKLPSKSLLGLKSVPFSTQILEDDLLVAILSGKLDLSVFSSLGHTASTDSDTTVDEDDLNNQANSDFFAAVPREDCLVTHRSLIEQALSNSEEQLQAFTSKIESTKGQSTYATRNANQFVLKQEKTSGSTVEGVAEVTYSSGLIVQKSWNTSFLIASDGAAPNFKHFRKGKGASGNSFSTLIPFAKEPYRESDFGREMKEYMNEEKKRKAAEALAEDLFHAEQMKRRRVTAVEAAKQFGGVK